MAKKQTNSQKDYEDLGKRLIELYDTGYFNNSRRQVYRAAFIKGMLAGFGGVLGATVLIGLLLWGLNLFQNVKVLDPVVDQVINSIESHN